MVSLRTSQCFRFSQSEQLPATSHAYPLSGSTLHKVPDAVEGANGPSSGRGNLYGDHTGQRKVGFQHLTTMWTGVGIEIIAKLNSTVRTFFSKHKSAKAREVPPRLEKGKRMERRCFRIQPTTQSSVLPEGPCTLPDPQGRP